MLQTDLQTEQCVMQYLAVHLTAQAQALQTPHDCVDEVRTASLAIAALAIGEPSLSDADNN
jgi:hypothetical protein